MSETIKQKVNTLQGAEQKVATQLQSILQTVQDSKLKETIQRFNQKTLERIAKLGQVIGFLKIKTEPTGSPAIDGIVKEIEQYTKSSSGKVTDTNITSGLQKLLSALAIDYSFTANIMHTKKQDSNAVSLLSESYDSLIKLNDELNKVAQSMFQQLGDSASSKGSDKDSAQAKNEPQKAQQEQSKKPGIVKKAKKAVSAAKQAIT